MRVVVRAACAARTARTARVTCLAACLAACTSSSPRIDSATPDVGPLAGGTRITLEGDNFPVGARVLVGDREAPFAAASLDGTKLEVVIPPGDEPGPAPITVVVGSTATTATTAFRYSSPPTITAVTPARVVTPHAITITGSGFVDDGAGTVIVLIDGVPITDLVVSNDTTLTFAAPPGPMLAQPTIQILDDRGTARVERAFRYVPSENPGLLAFPNYGGDLAIFYDLITRTTTAIPRPAPQFSRFTSVYRDGRGDFWAIDRNRRVGRIDFRTGLIADPTTLTTELPASTIYQGAVLAIDRVSIGTLDPITGTFARTFDTPLGCCGSWGIAADGDTLYVTSRQNGIPVLRMFDTQTATFNAPVTLQGSPTFGVEELRVVDHVLYATSRDNALYSIDPTTGQVTPLAPITRSSALELLP
jgi:hypothetical protein